MDRESLVYNARLAEQAERFDEMVEHMKACAKIGGELEPEERNLLSVAYKNVIGSRRRAWRVLLSIEQKSEVPEAKDMIIAYKQKVEDELSEYCSDINSIILEVLAPGTSDDEAKVFYHKMAGDYYRYQAEYTVDEAKEKHKDSAEAQYAKASEYAANLPVTDPIRLGLALNFSVFCYEIKEDPQAACSLANKAYEECLSELDSMQDDAKKDSELITQLLRDNLSLWNTDGMDMSGPGGGGSDDAPLGEGDLPIEDM